MLYSINNRASTIGKETHAMLKRIIRGLLVFTPLLLIIALIVFWRSDYHRIALPTVSGITAKQLCSMAFLSGLDPERTQAIYLKPQLDWAADLVSGELDRVDRSATASVYGLYRQTAVYREGLGCTLEHDGTLDRSLSVPMTVANRPLPEADTRRYNVANIEQALDRAFEEPPGGNRNTLAIVALHQGQIIAERYAEGIDPMTPLLGWSMAKSATTTLAGVLAQQGTIELTAPGAVPSPGDPSITLEHLLRMHAGLAIDERNDGTDPNSIMLWTSTDMAGFSAAQPQRHPPGAVFAYMSGNTNLAMRHLQDRLGPDLVSQVQAIQEYLFEPLGMATGLFEPDSAGTLVGSSYMWASARDWAKLGQLYLDGGRAGERQLLDASWIEEVGEYTPTSDDYGMGFWIYRRTPEQPNAIEMNGFQGQYTAILPAHELVIVRLGATNRQNPGFTELVNELIEVVREATRADS
ncbi:MAG: serine hydrolase [Pseudomonadota bacterium]